MLHIPNSAEGNCLTEKNHTLVVRTSFGFHLRECMGSGGGGGGPGTYTLFLKKFIRLKCKIKYIYPEKMANTSRPGAAK